MGRFFREVLGFTSLVSAARALLHGKMKAAVGYHLNRVRWRESQWLALGGVELGVSCRLLA
jgi:hypothetical protein